MNLIINISEDVYTRLFDKGIQDNEIATDDICEMAMAIRKGTPLPKGHGRLIDADELEKEKFLLGTSNYCEYQVVTMANIKDAKTIIEADKGESEE